MQRGGDATRAAQERPPVDGRRGARPTRSPASVASARRDRGPTARAGTNSPFDAGPAPNGSTAATLRARLRPRGSRPLRPAPGRDRCPRPQARSLHRRELVAVAPGPLPQRRFGIDALFPRDRDDRRQQLAERGLTRVGVDRTERGRGRRAERTGRRIETDRVGLAEQLRDERSAGRFVAMPATSEPVPFSSRLICSQLRTTSPLPSTETVPKT